MTLPLAPPCRRLAPSQVFTDVEGKVAKHSQEVLATLASL